jgi:hypothetical protein
MATYTPIQSIVITSAASSVTFSNIPQTYTDLVLIINAGNSTGNEGLELRIGNGSIDTGTNLSWTYMNGNGTSAGSGRATNISYTYAANSTTNLAGIGIVHLMNYSNTNVYKTIISKAESAYSSATVFVSTWRSTSAIDTFRVSDPSYNFTVGSTFDLYGIVSGTPYATGGNIVTTDGTYWYHAFTSTGTFTPNKTLSCDVLVIAGGASGAASYGGGGGAGGVSYLASTSLSNGTGYLATVGGGGAGASSGSAGGAGTNSSFNSSIISNGGGQGGTYSGTYNGSAGGSGGGGSMGATPGTGTSGGSSNQGSTGGATGYGNAGGGGWRSSGNANYRGGGGGGAGTAGQDAPHDGTAKATNGGNGLNTWSSWATATNTGVSGYYAGGGAGSSESISTADKGIGGLGGGGNGSLPNGGVTCTAGVVNTGSGGGADGATGGTLPNGGGSGIVIVRYPV